MSSWKLKTQRVVLERSSRCQTSRKEEVVSKGWEIRFLRIPKLVIPNTGLAEVREGEHDRHDNLHRPQHLLLHRVLHRRHLWVPKASLRVHEQEPDVNLSILFLVYLIQYNFKPLKSIVFNNKEIESHIVVISFHTKSWGMILQKKIMLNNFKNKPLGQPHPQCQESNIWKSKTTFHMHRWYHTTFIKRAILCRQHQDAGHYPVLTKLFSSKHYNSIVWIPDSGTILREKDRKKVEPCWTLYNCVFHPAALVFNIRQPWGDCRAKQKKSTRRHHTKQEL